MSEESREDILAIMKQLQAIILACCLLPVLAPAAETRVNVRQDGMMLTVDGWLSTSADAATAWRVLTDYPGFSRFVPGIHSSRVVESRGAVTLLEQRGEVIAGQLRMPFDGLMRIEETPREAIRIEFLSGPFKDARGEWNLHPGKPLRLTYRLRMDMMKSPFPPPLAPGIAEQQVRTWVEVFGREMELAKGNSQ